MGAIRVTMIHCYPSELWSGLLDPKRGTFSFQYANFVFVCFFFSVVTFLFYLKVSFDPNGEGDTWTNDLHSWAVSSANCPTPWAPYFGKPNYNLLVKVLIGDYVKVSLCHWPLSIVNAIRGIFNSFANSCSSLSISLQVFECH